MIEAIKDIAELKKLSKGQDLLCYIALNGGVRSSKTIFYNEKDNIFEIENEIDGVFQKLKSLELWTKSNIGEALDKHALFKH